MFLFCYAKILNQAFLHCPHICLWGFFTFLVDLAHGAAKQQSATLKVHRSVVTTDAFRTELELWSEFQSEKPSLSTNISIRILEKCTSEQDRTYSYYIYVLYRSSFASYIYYILVYGCVCSEILSYFEQRSKSGEYVSFKIVKNW